jgi:hypothetical protein
MLCCPKCSNDHLLVRRRNGWERVMMLFTVQRKYMCMSCTHSFRAPDRRRVRRPEADAVLTHAHTDAVRG